jgi:serine/threonine protein kinase/Tol biopolymer transport system component
MSEPDWAEVERAMATALEQPNDRRADYLQQLPQAIRSEVESLLEAHGRAGDFLAEPAADPFSDPAESHLAVGATLGHYRIEARLGQGGMGAVFKASDSRLGRSVAIKILSANALSDPERKRCFIQEARAVSALNHPNIVTLYDIDQQEGRDFLVMEYVPAKSLDRLIRSKGLPLIEAVRYAAQIASALAAAHAARIVHRDIKPANLMVTSESQVKVLDFGVAKLVEHAPVEVHSQESTLTRTGTVIGTVAYMSPEQASLRPVDHRSDIFSLGIVLYEMLLGERPFRGRSHDPSIVETLHAIVNDTVSPPSSVNSALPPELDEILAKAMAKELRERYQHAGDLELDLRRFERAWETKSLPSMRVASDALPRRARRGPIIAALALSAATFAVGVWLAPGILSSADNPLANATFTRFTDFGGATRDAAVSPDGKFVAFVSDRDGRFDIWLGRVGAGQFVNVTQGKEPSLDSTVRETGFAGDGSELWMHDAEKTTLMRLFPIMGGPPRIFLGKGPGKTPPAFAAWTSDGAQVAFHTSDPGDPIFVADRNGSGARQILIDRPGFHQHWEAWSQDGKWIYFVKGNPIAREWDLYRIQSSGGPPQRLTHHNSYVVSPAPIDPYTVLYVAQDQDGSGPWLWALDVRRNMTRRVSFGLEQYTSISASADGHRLAATVANPTATLWSVPILDHPADERDAKPISVPTVRALAPRFGGTSLFYLSSRGAGDGLWRYQDGQASEIWKGRDGTLLLPAAISPGGQRAALTLRTQGKLNLFTISSEGADYQPLSDLIDVQGAGCWSPDGKWIVTGGSDAQGPGLFKIPADGGTPVRIAVGPALNPVWSPDGALIVYAGADIGGYARLVAVHPDGTPAHIPNISVFRGGERFRFLPDRTGLVYMQGVIGSQDFWLLDTRSGKTRPLTRLHATAAMRTFDITPDSKTIVFDRMRENSDIVLIDLARGR